MPSILERRARRRREAKGAYIRGCRDPEKATRDRVTARYLWDTNREIIEARCAAISRHPESFNKSWKYGGSGQYRERDTSGRVANWFHLIRRLTLINCGYRDSRSIVGYSVREVPFACLPSINDGRSDESENKCRCKYDTNISSLFNYHK